VGMRTLDEGYRRFKLPLVPFNSTATADGNAAGTTLVCSILAGKAAAVFNSCAVILTEGTYQGFKSPVMAYDTTTGTFTLGDGLGAIITAGTRFAVVPAEAVSVDVTLHDTLVYVGICPTGMAGSTTAFTLPDMVGRWADNYFNTGWVALCILDSDGPGTAPEGEFRDITDYDSATGGFTTAAFSADLEGDDVMMIVRTEIVLAWGIRAVGTSGRIYFAAEDVSTTEITDDGTNPMLLAEVSQANADEAAGMATPAFGEAIDLDLFGNYSLKDILACFIWQMKRSAGTYADAKWQISGDGGSTWVDVTGNMRTLKAVYDEMIVQGIGLWITQIDGGVDQLHIRLCAWTDGTTVETRVRTNSYVEFTWEKVA